MRSTKGRTYWLGPIVSEEFQSLSKAISSAANKWQIEFINGLIENEVDLSILTYMPEQVWPKGKIWKSYSQSEKLGKYKIISTGYLNLFLIRDLWIPSSLFLKMIFRKEFKEFRFLYTYNIPFRHRLFTYLGRWFLPKFKWISIIADVEADGKPDYTLFLSYTYFNRFQEANKIFLDGGVPFVEDSERPIDLLAPKVLLYAGTISEWTGIDQFCIDFNRISPEINMELHIYGKGDPTNIIQIAKGNKKIKYLGFASEEKLHSACQEAYVFINPRPINAYLGDNNFPSKLLMYLSYRKPILSTKTSNLSPSYDALLNYYGDEKSLREQLIAILNSSEEYKRKCEIIGSYIAKNSWRDKIKQVLSSIEYHKISCSNNN
jgi:hypothetical protein